MQRNKIQKEKGKYLTWPKKPISLAVLIYFLYHIGFWILLLIEYGSFSMYETFSNTALHLNLNITHDITDFLALLSASLFVSIMCIKKYNIKFTKIDISKISLYFSLIKLLEIKAGEKFSIPNLKMNIIDLAISDFLLIITNFIIMFIFLWLSNKIAPSIKDAYFDRVVYKICIVSFIFLLIILNMLVKHYL